MFKWWDYIQQGGFSQSEKYWHLGMTILGDPTIIPVMHFLGVEGDPPPAVNLLVGPNPGPGSVTITAAGPISVFDTAGRRVALGSGSLTLTGLAPGVYLVRAGTGPGAETGRFTVIR